MVKKANLDFWLIIKIVLFFLLAFFLVYPMFNLFKGSFFDVESGKFSLEYYKEYFSRSYYFKAFRNSMTVSSLATLLTVLVGAPLAYIMTRFRIRGKRFLAILIIISLLSPPFIGAYSWIMLLGRSGVITKLLSYIGINIPSIYGFKGILLVFVLKLFPYVYLYVAGALKSIDSSLEEAAESLGSTNIRKIMTVTFPLIMPTMLGGALLVFMTALADFGTPMILGEGYVTMPVLIYSEFVGEVGGSAGFASAISVLLVLFIIVVFYLQRYIVNKRTYEMSALRPVEARELKGSKKFFAYLYCYVIVGLATIPQIVVVYTSFLETNGPIFTGGYSINSYTTVIRRMGDSIQNSFIYSIVAVVIMIIVTLFISYLSVRRKSFSSNMLDTMVMLPYIIPGTVIGITYLITFNSRPLILSGTAAIIILSLVIRRTPTIIRSSTAILYQIDPSIEEASISLGYHPAKTFFKVTVVMMLPGIFSGAILAWIRSICELSSSIILYSGSTKTMAVAIYVEVIRTSFGTAAAISTILIGSTVIALMLFFKLTGREEISL